MKGAQKKHKKVGNYELKETIGRGTFSKVKRATNAETGEQVAIKIIDIQNLEKEGMEKQVKREILVLKNIKHRNVVQMIEVLKSANHIYIVMEVVTGGELFDRIVAQKRFDEDTARYYFHQLIDGIRYCHKVDVAHRDLKPENLLLSGNTLKISDFGLSGIMKNNTPLSTICGTPHYVAPEVLSGSYDGKQADIWSCGIILFVMISGCHPFDGDNVNDLFKRIEQLEFKYPPYFSRPVRALLDKIIVVDPVKRATIEDILNDAWFKVDYNKPFKSTTSEDQVQTQKGEQDDYKNAITDANVEYGDEKEHKHVVAENLNAFEIVSYLTKDILLGTNCHVSFIAQGPIKEVFEKMCTFLHNKKITTKIKEEDYELKGRVKSTLSELEFSIRLIPLSGYNLMFAEFVRLKGNVLKYHEVIRIVRERFSITENPIKMPLNASAIIVQPSTSPQMQPSVMITPSSLPQSKGLLLDAVSSDNE